MFWRKKYFKLIIIITRRIHLFLKVKWRIVLKNSKLVMLKLIKNLTRKI